MYEKPITNNDTIELFTRSLAESLPYTSLGKIPFAMQAAVLKEIPAASTIATSVYAQCLKDNVTILDELAHCRSPIDFAHAEWHFLLSKTEEALAVAHQVAGVATRIAAASWLPHYVRKVQP